MVFQVNKAKEGQTKHSDILKFICITVQKFGVCIFPLKFLMQQ